jgi:hypothetical protein
MLLSIHYQPFYIEQILDESIFMLFFVSDVKVNRAKFLTFSSSASLR